MVKFIEEDFEISKENPFDMLKSLLIMVLVAPARYLLTIFSKVLYLPKAILEKVLLCATIISASISLTNVAVSLYFKSFRVSSLFFQITVISTIVLVLFYFIFAMSSIVLYEQMDNMKDKEESPSKEQLRHVANTAKSKLGELFGTGATFAHAVNEENSADAATEEVSDLTESTAEDVRADIKPAERSSEELDLTEQTRSTEHSVKSVDLDVTNDFDDSDIFASEDENEENDTSDDADYGFHNIVKAESIAHFQDHLKEKVKKAKSERCSIGKQISEGELHELLSEMDNVTDPSKFIPEEVLASFGVSAEELDDLSIEMLEDDMVPSNFTALY